jgi:hypothetical protein
MGCEEDIAHGNINKSKRTETGVLPCYPLLCSADIQRVFEPEFMIRIVVAREVIENGKSFHHGVTASVMINDYWNATVRAKFDEPVLLLVVVLENVNILERIVPTISFLELLKQDRDLEAYDRSE